MDVSLAGARPLLPPSRPLQTPDGNVSQDMLDTLGIKAGIVYDAQPMKSDGAHMIFKGVNARGEKVVVKDNSVLADKGGGALRKVYEGAADLLSNKILPGSGRLQNINDILLRQIFKDHIDCPVIPGKEAVFMDPTTHQLHFGIQSPWVENMSDIEDAKAPPVANPMQAARGVVYSSLLMGNWDSTWHEGNNNEISDTGRMSDGTPESKGEYLQADLGWGGQRGNSVLGIIPFGSLELLHNLPKQDVQAAVQEVIHLPDDQIRSWVDEAGRQTITGWNDKLCDFYTDALITNRNRLAHHVEVDPSWLTHPLDEGFRGPREKLGQRLFMPGVIVQKYANMATSGVLHSVTSHAQMAQEIQDALKSQNTFPSTRIAS